jgi:hypothetical protein
MESLSNGHAIEPDITAERVRFILARIGSDKLARVTHSGTVCNCIIGIKRLGGFCGQKPPPEAYYNNVGPGRVGSVLHLLLD